MRIWVIQDGEPIPGIDGDVREWRAAMLSKALVARGHDVFWWASTFDHASKKHRFGQPCTIELMPNLKVRLLHGPGYAQNKALKRFWHHRTLAGVFAKEAATADKPDLIYGSVPTLELAEQAVLHAQKIRVPVVIDVRDLWPDLYLTLVPKPFRRLLRALLFSEFRRASRLFQGATGIVAISTAYLDWALKYTGRPRTERDHVFEIGYSGPPMTRQDQDVDATARHIQSEYKIQTGALVVTFVGSFGASYDLETVVRAARELQASPFTQEVKIVLAGGGDRGSQLRAMADGTSSVIFTGWLDQLSLVALLKLSSVGLAAYMSDALQTLPNKPYEYMAAGLPILSSLRGELEDLVLNEQIGLQYQAGNVDSLVQQICWLAAHPIERQAMGRRARKLFEERFSAEIIYPSLVRHLEQIACYE